MCVLYTGSLTGIYIGIHRRARTGRHYYKTCVRVNPFVLRFRRRRRRRCCCRRHRLSRSRRVGFFSVLGELRFLFASLPFSLDPSRPSARSFRIPECKRDARARTHRDRIRITLSIESLIGRSKEEDRVLRACHFIAPPECSSFVCKEAKGEQRDRSSGSNISYTSFAE